MQVKKSQKIFEFFDFFEGVQEIFCAMGGALKNLVAGKKRGQKCAMEIFALRIQMLVKE